MADLNSTLGIGRQALSTAQQGMSTTSHNISNAQTEGFSRQRIDVRANHPVNKYGNLIGTGSLVNSVDRSKDLFVERKINETYSVAGESETRFKSLREIESIFSPESDGSVAQELDRFFENLQSLSTNPDDLSIRNAFRNQASALALSFNNTDTQLHSFKSGLNEQIKTYASELNQVVKHIANLNVEISVSESRKEQQANDLRDRRDLLLSNLSKIIDIDYFEDERGMLGVRGPGTVLLVDGNHSNDFTLEAGDNGLYQVHVKNSSGEFSQNITEKMSSGELKAVIDVRDNLLSDLIERNDQLAYKFSKSFNDVHRQGFGLGEFANINQRNFFKDIETVKGAASNFKTDISVANSTNAISSASTMFTSGDNVNINRMLDLKSKNFMENGSATFNEFFSNNVSLLGIEAQRSERESESNNVLLADLKARADDVSGVSLDEEAIDMIKWQKSYTTSSKLISVIDEMYETLLSIK